VILAVAGTKGAPGATTMCLGVACLLRARRAVSLVEACPGGGCIAGRWQGPQEPGLGTLAAAGRHQLSEAVLGKHLQGLPGGPAAIVAPSSPTHARTALRAVAEGLALLLATIQGVDVVIDTGRLDAESPSLALAGAAGHLVFIGRPTVEDADAIAVRLVELGELRRRSSLVTVGQGAYDGAEVARILAVDHAGHVPKDDQGAAFLWSSPDKALRSRRPLVRSLAQFTARLEPPASPRVETSPDERPGTARRHRLVQRAAR